MWVLERCQFGSSVIVKFKFCNRQKVLLEDDQNFKERGWDRSHLPTLDYTDFNLLRWNDISVFYVVFVVIVVFSSFAKKDYFTLLIVVFFVGVFFILISHILSVVTYIFVRSEPFLFYLLLFLIGTTLLIR